MITPLILSLLAVTPPTKIKALYNSLDPTSISEHLAFYELYPKAPEGQAALRDAWKLLSPGKEGKGSPLPLGELNQALEGIVHLVTKPAQKETLELPPPVLEAIDTLAAHLPHRRLKGHAVQSEEEVLKLAPEEIDLARGLLLSQMGTEWGKIRSYEAVLDLMALQILSKQPKDATPAQKIRAINTFIFDEMGYRFPPHSAYAKDIDVYTFLPSVLDSRRGVCLGVSILYLCLSQRLGLPLEMITPPGHIYIRYREKDGEINIETTARGIHVDSQEYLSVDTRSLQERTIKEVIGLAHFNQASVYWKQKDYTKALKSYEKAFPYMPHDMLLKELMAYTLLYNGQKERALSLLNEVKGHIPDYAVYKETVAEDFLEGKVDEGSISILFEAVDENRESLLAKKELLEDIVKRNPQFRAGLTALATTWLQLHRVSEALPYLEKVHALDPHDPTIEYYLAELYFERMDYNKAWIHLKNAENLTASRNHNPKALKELRQTLLTLNPE